MHTIITGLGGEAMDLISVISFFSRFSSACAA
jgi:hypothetical protein